MGMLYTLPEHRRRGLAKISIASLVIKLIEKGYCKNMPFVFIENKNEASKNLFTSLGFTKISNVVWAGYKTEPPK